MSETESRREYDPNYLRYFRDPSYKSEPVKVRRWLVPDGAAVKPGDLIVEIETDKVAVEIPATAFGTLIISVPAGSTVRQQDIIGEIDDSESSEKNVWPPPPTRSEGSPTFSRPSKGNYNPAYALFTAGIFFAGMAGSYLGWEILILALPAAAITLFIRESRANKERVPGLAYILPSIHFAIALAAAALSKGPNHWW